MSVLFACLYDSVKGRPVGMSTTGNSSIFNNNYIHGKVFVEGWDKPIEGGVIAISGRETYIDGNGGFMIQGIQSGEVLLNVFYKGRFVYGRPLHLFNGDNYTNITIDSFFSRMTVRPYFQDTPESEVFKPVKAKYFWKGNGKVKKIALTIDDGWNADPRILDLLGKYGIRCSVFVIGGRGVGEKHPEWIAKMDGMGFEVCSHTYSHGVAPKMSTRRFIYEIRKGQEVISRVTHKVYPFIRTSGGFYNKRVLKIAAQNGFYLVNWSISLVDTSRRSKPAKQKKYILDHIMNGDIILSHFGGYNTYEVLKGIIPVILERGYRFVTLSELLYDQLQ
ncbi:MAG: polysaccharide deacetylase family protein [Spirochaetales bacterium]|nr:polysaccharide deacetylase family protein [Spirochaetales bacterium]